MICFMIIYELPYFSAQFCRILILEYSDYVDQTAQDQDSPQIRKLNAVNNILNFVYLALGLLMAFYTLGEYQVWLEFKKRANRITGCLCRGKKMFSEKAFKDRHTWRF